MPFTEDLTTFFNTDEFAVTAAVDYTDFNGNVNGVFDREFAQVTTIGGVPMDGYHPTFTCAEADVPGIDYGATITIDSVTYSVVDPQPDGTGIVKLILRKT